MSILFTSDWQAEWSTLDKCELALNEVLAISKERKIKYICMLGDFKEAYNPVDVRIIKWWKYAFKKMVNAGLKVIALLGNHDRVGSYSNADNWLSIFKRRGIYLFEHPGSFIADDITLYLLPYHKTNETRLGARKCKEMASKSTSKCKILCFHHNLLEARYNRQGSKSDAKLSTNDLKCTYYNYCIGGDIHYPQKLNKNTYYVGSPFCTSWGEVNQQKRYLVISRESIISVHSRIPRWFDPDINGFQETKPRSFRGHRVRIQVSCNASQDYGRRLEKARRRAERKYKGAEIYVVPKFTETALVESQQITADSSDERKIRQYIRETKHGNQETTIQYILEKLSHFSSGLRTASRVKFIRAIGTNFLSFKHLDMDLTKKGITLIQGINEDRNNKSNGGGKTSALQVFPVAWFGHTFKDQKHDSWANRWRPKEPAFAEAISKTADGKIVKVIRGRRPPLLRMYVDGKEVSSGMRSTDREGTQQQIEKITGFTWQTLANAVYIDREITNAFLAGTRKSRTDVLSRFQNIERFDGANKLVKLDIKSNADSTYEVERTLSGIRSAIKESGRSLRQIKAISRQQLKDIKTQYKKAKHTRVQYVKVNKSKIKAMQTKAGFIDSDYLQQSKVVNLLQHDKAVLHSRIVEQERKLNKARELEEKKQCPTCLQDVEEHWIKAYIKGIIKSLKDLKHKFHAKSVLLHSVTKRVNHLSDSHDSFQNKLSELKNKEDSLQLSEESLRRQYEKLQREEQNDSSVLSKARQRIKKLTTRKEELKNKLKKLDIKRRMYEYVSEAFSRDGIPAFLNRQLCPVLNKASSYYADLFSDSEVGVQFVIERGDFVPKIINSTGGAEIEDQSEGERALAGLIASFALREAAPQCNVLMLDEPGNGLDSETARQFARSLQTLVKRFGAIYICTHNQVILSELSNERIITVRKHHKISRMEAA